MLCSDDTNEPQEEPMNTVQQITNGFTNSDLRAQREFLLKAHGSVLVTGCGRGGFLHRLVAKPNVDYLTVVLPDRVSLRTQERELERYGDRITLVCCTLTDICNPHVFDAIYETPNNG
jgi:cyclopropane fatty-acyl-phospholipid synthase-like methyltransferase